MAGIVAGSIGGWSPIGRRDEEGSSRYSQTRDRADLEGQEGLEIHPGTDPHDPIIAKDPKPSHMPPSQVSELTPAFGQSVTPSERHSSKDHSAKI